MERLRQAILALQSARLRRAPQEEIDAALQEYHSAAAELPVDLFGEIASYLNVKRAKYGLVYDGKGPAEPTPRLNFLKWLYLNGHLHDGDTVPLP